MYKFSHDDMALIFVRWTDLTRVREKIIKEVGIKLRTNFIGSSPCLIFSTKDDFTKYQEAYPEEFI